MSIQHSQLQKGGWKKLSMIEQLANIGSEVERTIKWRNKGNNDYSQQAFFRSLELLDFSLSDSKNKLHLSEFTRLREILVDYFYGQNKYSSSDKELQRYFYNFTFASRAASF